MAPPAYGNMASGRLSRDALKWLEWRRIALTCASYVKRSHGIRGEEWCNSRFLCRSRVRHAFRFSARDALSGALLILNSRIDRFARRNINTMRFAHWFRSRGRLSAFLHDFIIGGRPSFFQSGFSLPQSNWPTITG